MRCSFLAAYTVKHVVAGRVLDAVGTRLGFAVAVAWWPVASMLHAFSRGVASLCAYRFLLGVGETLDLRRLIRLRPIWASAWRVSSPIRFGIFTYFSYLATSRMFVSSVSPRWATLRGFRSSQPIWDLTGGAASSWPTRRGWPVFRARHTAMLGSALLMPAALFAARAGHPAAAVAWISLATFGHQFWSANLLMLPADLLPSRHVGSAYGLAGGAGSLGASLVSFSLGHVISSLSYRPVFTAAGLMHPLAAWSLSSQ